MATTQAIYRDADLPIEVRTADLLGRMTVEEKVAQLGSVWSFELLDGGHVGAGRARTLIGAGIGEISRLAGATNLVADEVAAVADEIQRFLLEETRLGIPAILHEESLHGLLARDAPSFQQSIGAAAAWDPPLVEEMATTVRRRMLATGARHSLSPVLDVTRDPRWGRVEETYGEDPYLAAELGCAYIRGLQGDDLSHAASRRPPSTWSATGSRKAGSTRRRSTSDRARCTTSSSSPSRRPSGRLPSRASCRPTATSTACPATPRTSCSRRSSATAGGSTASSPPTTPAIQMLSTQHRLTADLGVAAGMALRAGVDSELPNAVAYASPLIEAVAAGRVDEAVLDAAVGRILRLKFRLGLFERPFVERQTSQSMAALAADEARIARDLARRSMVLVENDGILPLRPGLARVAVVGPLADSARDLLGDYAHLLHIETLREMRDKDNAFGFPLTEEIVPADELAGRQTILDAIRARLGEAEVAHARGTGLVEGSDDELAAAVAAARDAEVAIVVLGERSGLTDDATTGEFRDRRDLGFIGRQEELLEAVVGTGTPVVLVVVSGRPLAIGWAAEHCAAVLLAWVPGEAGPEAIADVLVGVENPGGHLPISVPRNVGQVPVSYRHHPTGGRSNPKGSYVDGPTTPLWPFGFGRSYTTFAVSDLRLDRARIPTSGGEVVVSVDVENTGPRRGDTVVQLYARDVEASVARPVLELRGFQRVGLEPGERRTVEFRLSAEQFAYVGADRRRIVEPGVVTLSTGTSSADLPLSVALTLDGPTVDLVERTRYLTETTIA